MNQTIIKKPAIAWLLLTTRKVSSIGKQPYVFIPGTTIDVAVECLVGWNDGYSEGDRMEYGFDEQDKIRLHPGILGVVSRRGDRSITPAIKSIHSGVIMSHVRGNTRGLSE